jgi:outer membrane biogenesis lipoprotein LolB
MDADSVDPAELKAILGETSLQLRSRASGSDAQSNKGSVFCANGVKQEP